MESETEKNSKNLLEWAVFIVASILVVGALCFLMGEIYRNKQAPAKLRVELKEPMVEGGWIRYPIHIINDGNQVAENVSVQVTLERASVKESATMNISFVPSKTTRRGSVAFKGNILPERVECDVLSYEEP